METPRVGMSGSELLSYCVDILLLVLLSKHTIVQELAVVFVIYLKDLKQLIFFLIV